MKLWDVFISHASEDKTAFVEPLALALANVGLAVWYDKFTLKLGDSLSRSIDEGLANSRYGVVIISPAFLQKSWTAYELAGLVTREVTTGKVILPVWHHVTRDQIIAKSPTLADKLAVRTEDATPADIALQILQVVRPDLYEATDRAALVARMDGTALRQLEEELQRVREELSEFQCPDCGAPLVESMEVHVTERDSDNLRRFECGGSQWGDGIEDLCPSNPRFPKFEDLPLSIHQSGDGWMGYVAPGAKLGVWFNPISAKTEGEVLARLRAAYDKRARIRFWKAPRSS